MKIPVCTAMRYIEEEGAERFVSDRSNAGSPRLVAWIAKLSGRKVVRCHQCAPLVGFQGYLLGEHDVARDEMIVRYEA